MSKTHRQVVRTDAEREEEAPSHKTRRRFKLQLDDLRDYDDLTDEDFEEIERSERIRKKPSR